MGSGRTGERSEGVGGDMGAGEAQGGRSHALEAAVVAGGPQVARDRCGRGCRRHVQPGHDLDAIGALSYPTVKPQALVMRVSHLHSRLAADMPSLGVRSMQTCVSACTLQ